MKIFSNKTEAKVKVNKKFNKSEMLRRLDDTKDWVTKGADIAEKGVQELLKSNLGDTIQEYAIQRSGNVIVALLKVDNPDRLSPRELGEKYETLSGSFNDTMIELDNRELEREGYNVALRANF